MQKKKSTLHVCGSHFTSGRPASLQDEKHKGNKILYDLMNQNEIINSVTANNNDSKETQTELSLDIQKKNKELRTLNQKLYDENLYFKNVIKRLKKQ